MEAVVKKHVDLRRKKLNNYINIVEREFDDIFSREDYSFVNTKYKHFLYFGKEECRAFLQDYINFINRAYNTDVFALSHYYSIIDNFSKYLDANNVYFKYQTLTGVKLINHDGSELVKTFQKLVSPLIIGNDKENPTRIAFGNITNNDAYTFEFFDLMEKKAKLYYNVSNYLIEPLFKEDVKGVERKFMGEQIKQDNPPFYLNFADRSHKEIKSLILQNFFTLTVGDMVWSIFDKELEKEIALVSITDIEKDKATINIVCESEYMNADFSKAIKQITYHVFTKTTLKKLLTVNHNKGLAYSNLNTCLIIAKYLPDYSTAPSEDGYTFINYSATKDKILEEIQEECQEISCEEGMPLFFNY